MCVQSHAAIDAAFVTERVIHQDLERVVRQDLEQVIRQDLEPVVQGEQLPELKLEDFAVFFWRNLFQPYVKVYIM